MQGQLDDMEQESHGGDHKSQLKSMGDTVRMWLSLLPEQLAIDSQLECGHSTLQRFLGSEIAKGKRILASVREDLTSVMYVIMCFLLIRNLCFRNYCNGTTKLTNHVADLLSSLNKGRVPHKWASYYTTNADISGGPWLTDLSSRCSSLMAYTSQMNTTGGAAATFWLGGMFSPESFIAASRQHAAQVRSIPSCCNQYVSILVR